MQELKIIGKKSNIYPIKHNAVTEAKYDNAHSIYISLFRKKALLLDIQTAKLCDIIIIIIIIIIVQDAVILAQL